MNRCLFIVLIISASACLHGAQGREVENRKYGFRLSVPDTFQELPLEQTDAKTLYQFAEHAPDPTNPPLMIQVQQLVKHIDPHQRLSKSELDVIKQFSPTLQEFQWKGLIIDVMRMVITLPPGKLVAYSIQYPLAGAAVQLQVGGMEGREAEVKKLFQETAAKFENLEPLEGRGPQLVVREMSWTERVESLFSGITRMAAVAILAVLGLRALMKSRKGANKPAAVPPPLDPEQ
jgi:hypothetical protein